MSIKTMLRVWEHSQTRGAMRCLMLAIANFANDDGIAWPGTASIAAYINETDDYTDTLIKKCIESGELLKISGRGRGNKTRFAILCGLQPDAMSRVKGALQNPYSSTPFSSEKGVLEKGVLQKGFLPSEKRGTFSDAKQSPSEAAARAKPPIVKNANHHDPSHGGGGGGAPAKKAIAPAGSDVKKALASTGMYPATIRQILKLGIDAPTLIASVEALCAEGWGPGAIADRLRDDPPAKGKPYERRSDLPQNRPVRPSTQAAGRPDPGRAELDRILAKYRTPAE